MICALIGLAAAASDADDVHAEVKTLLSDVRADGFEAKLETTNHIDESRSGDEHGNIHGDFSWKSPEGADIHVTYVANENGYQPSSNVLPTPPPTPPEIIRALEYLATHASQEKNH